MKFLFILVLSFVLISCNSSDNEIDNNSDKIVELISNNPISIISNDFTNFNTEFTYNNNNISFLKASGLGYFFNIQNDLISECVLNYNNTTYRFFYEFYSGTNSQKLNSIKVYHENQLEKEYSINFDGFREIIINGNNINEEYGIIFDEFNRIRAFSGLNSRKLLYTYENNNLVSIEIDYQYKIDIQFDNKKNPFNLERFKNLNDIINYINIINGDDLLLLNNYNIFSNSNNIISININDYPENDFQNFIYEYEYNYLNYPTKKKDSNFGLEVQYVYE